MMMVNNTSVYQNQTQQRFGFWWLGMGVAVATGAALWNEDSKAQALSADKPILQRHLTEEHLAPGGTKKILFALYDSKHPLHAEFLRNIHQ
jgi:hypothetical protein